eukprot:TRINITY_DN7612_c0_g1_i1.p1 TRINITY_DN7612_c0_g1~~TRINITY_DN7612_c0_g1_i1.p1  ORF type:complete len:373 (-),score=110.29 TRINITY_DN7612_c0_g1_i1:152-1270(-)
MERNGVRIYVNENVTEIREEEEGDKLVVKTKSDKEFKADIVIMGVGVSPDSELAKGCGLETGVTRGIKVNDHMLTSDPNIYAVGDVVETKDFVTGRPVLIALAGPASRQARIAADHISGRQSKYRGTQGTSIIGVFDVAAGMTGLSEKLAIQWNIPYEKSYIHPNDHVAYYPNSSTISIKVLFDPTSGKLLGAQVVGKKSVDKEIDVLATAIQGGMTVYDLEEIELCYAPAFGAPKSPINMIGFVGAGTIRGDQKHVHPEVVAKDHHDDLKNYSCLIDVRCEAAFKRGSVPGAVNIPLENIRDVISMENDKDFDTEKKQKKMLLPKDKKIVVVCFQGKTANNARSILEQHGYDAVVLSGGVTTYNNIKDNII